MRLHLLLALMMAAPICLGSSCSGSSTGKGAATASSSNTTQFDAPDQSFATPMPEPSAALIFGVGLLIAGVASRRRS